MKKRNKLQKISLIAVGILVLAGLGLYFNHQKVLAQIDSTVLPTPTITNQVFPGGVIFSWKIPKADVYGFKVQRYLSSVANPNLNKDEKGHTLAIFNPDPVGYKHISDGGMYTDFNVVKGIKYTYYITTFDRQGNRSPAATFTITAQ